MSKNTRPHTRRMQRYNIAQAKSIAIPFLFLDTINTTSSVFSMTLSRTVRLFI